MSDKPVYVMAKVVLAEPGKVQFMPIASNIRCAVNECGQPSRGLFSWPDEDTRVHLCEKHARILMAKLKDAG